MNLSKNILVFSVWQHEKTQRENITNIMKIVEVLRLNKENEFITLVKHYKRQTEISFAIKNTFISRAFVLGLARKFHQESILEVNEHCEASLVYLNCSTPERLTGHWNVCSARLAKKLGSSSYEPVSNTNWSVFRTV